MDFVYSFRHIIDYINEDNARYKYNKEYASEYTKVTQMMRTAYNVYKSILKDVCIYGGKLDIVLPNWDIIEAECTLIHDTHANYVEPRYIYSRWLYYICKTYTMNAIKCFIDIVPQSIYECDNFIANLNMSMFCFHEWSNPNKLAGTDPNTTESFVLAPVCIKPDSQDSRSIYKYDPNYEYSYDYINGNNTVFALLSKRR